MGKDVGLSLPDYVYQQHCRREGNFFFFFFSDVRFPVLEFNCGFHIKLLFIISVTVLYF